MANNWKGIVIGPKTIEMDDLVLLTHQLVSFDVSVGSSYEEKPVLSVVEQARFDRMRMISILLYGGAILGIVVAINASSGISFVLALGLGIAGAFTNPTRPAPKMRRAFRLTLTMADGTKRWIEGRQEGFIRSLHKRLREAVTSTDESPIIYQVNVQAEKIERLDANSTVVSNSAGAVVAGGSIQGGERAVAMDRQPATTGAKSFADMMQQARDQMSTLAETAVHSAVGAVNGGRPAAAERAAHLRQGAVATSANTVNISGAAPGAIIAGGHVSMPGAHVSTHGSIVHEFDDLVAVLSHMSMTHKAEILDYIRPVRDHLAGGATPREDARTRWTWFMAHVATMVSGVDGAMAVVERIGRLLGVVR